MNLFKIEVDNYFFYTFVSIHILYFILTPNSYVYLFCGSTAERVLVFLFSFFFFIVIYFHVGGGKEARALVVNTLKGEVKESESESRERKKK